jgi:serine/threonine protein kinase
MGAGSQAKTFLARDEKASGERTVVVKQLVLGDGASWKKFDLFEREAKVLRALSHPGIPRLLDRFESEPGTFNLVLERAPGASLRAIATKVRFSDDDLRDVLRRVADILTYMHGRRPPVIHRDIKPANLVRAADHSIRLVDFGGVRDALRDDGGSTVVGTFGYMAPEQLHGEATPATDLYGLGATLVALGTGVEPDRIKRRGLRMDLRAHMRDSDPALVELLEALTAPDPAERPQSATEVLASLAAAPRRRRREPAALARVAPDPLEGVPAPLALVTRAMLAVIGTIGYVGVTVVKVALVPLVFALIFAFARDASKPKLADTQAKIRAALGDGQDAFRELQGRPPRRALPEGRGPDGT